MMTEYAVSHGYLSARVKGHAEKRQREWAKAFGEGPKATGKPNLAGWQKLAEVFGKGFGSVETERIVQ